MDISEIKNTLFDNCNCLINEYLELVENNVESSAKFNDLILKLKNQNKSQLKEISELQTELNDYKKKSYDYEIIINNLQKELSENNNNNQDATNNGSIIKIQADSIREKDIYIEQLLKKTDFLQNKLISSKKNIKLSIAKDDTSLNESKDGLKGDTAACSGWSPTSSLMPAASPPNESEGKPKGDATPNESEGKPKGDATPNESEGESKDDATPNESEGESKDDATPNESEGEPKDDATPNESEGEPKDDTPPNESEGKPKDDATPNESEGNQEDITINTKRIKFKKKPYIIILGENPQYIYSINENDCIGEKVGVQKLTKSGNKTIKFF